MESCINYVIGHGQCAAKNFEAVTDAVCSRCELVKDMQLQPTAPELPKCTHLGSRRRCCDNLFICRKHSDNCINSSGITHPEVRCCQTCEDFEHG